MAAGPAHGFAGIHVDAIGEARVQAVTFLFVLKAFRCMLPSCATFAPLFSSA
jgi:hypothetical protein